MTEPTTMGSYLRAARRRRRISIERASEDTRIRADFLMRMESDEFDFMAPTYVRGFLKNYARFLHVDPEPLLDEFDRRFGTGRVDTSEIIALTQRDRTPRPTRRDIPRWVFVVAGVVVILVILTLIGLAAPNGDPGRDDPRSERSPLSQDEQQGDEQQDEQQTPAPEGSATAAAGEAAFADGIDVLIHAVRGDCYLEITVDGEEEFIGTLGQLQSQEYKAQENMVITFGAPNNVDLTVEGEDLGDPSAPGEGTVTIRLPKDYDRLKKEARQDGSDA